MKFGAALLLPVKHPEPAEDNVLLVEVEVIVQRAVIVATVVRDSGAPFNTDSFEVNELLRIGAAACPRRRHDKSVRAPEWSGTLQVARSGVQVFQHVRRAARGGATNDGT